MLPYYPLLIMVVTMSRMIYLIGLPRRERLITRFMILDIRAIVMGKSILLWTRVYGPEFDDRSCCSWLTR
jgi:hypothetical protein